MSESRPGLTALLILLAVGLLVGVIAFIVPITPCPACTPLADLILGANAAGEELRIECPNCNSRRRVTFIQGRSGTAWALRNPYLRYLYSGEQTTDFPQILRIPPHTVEDGPVALPVLIRAIRAQDPHVALRAGTLLGEMGPRAAAAAPELRAALQDRNRKRSSFAQALGFIGAEPAEGVPLLMEVLREPTGGDGMLRPRAVFGLAAFGAHAKPAIPLLTAMLHDPSQEARYAAAYALGKLGPDSNVAVPELTRLASGDDSPAEAAREALKQLEATR